MKVPAKLKKVLDKHLPFETASARAIQRTAALYLGHEKDSIDPSELRELCEALSLFDIAAGEGSSGRYAGTSTFAANFTANMRKDGHYFSGDHQKGWKLTALGKKEAKAVFEEGLAPTKRKTPSGGAASKPKAAKKTSKKKTSTKKKATKTSKKKASGGTKKKASGKKTSAKKTSTKKKAAASKAKAKKTKAKGNPAPKAESSASTAKRKAALKKKRNLRKKEESTPPPAEPVVVPDDADAVTEDW